jgi:hypothetical protein
MTDNEDTTPDGLEKAIAEAPQPSAAAIRARAHRRRRRKGQRCVSITLDPVEIDGLVEKGYLSSTDRDNAAAIQFAAECCLSDVLLGFTP